MNDPKQWILLNRLRKSQPGDTVSLTAQVGYSADIRDENLPWPGGRMVLFTLGPDGSQEEVAEKDLPQFNSEDAGTFKTLALKWKVPKEKAARKIGVRWNQKARRRHGIIFGSKMPRGRTFRFADWCSAPWLPGVRIRSGYLRPKDCHYNETGIRKLLLSANLWATEAHSMSHPPLTSNVAPVM